MKIDLHCHTLNCKSGDGVGREPSLELFTRKVEEAGVQILAITNHNRFDIEQYYSFRESVSEFCDVWPGIELDVKEYGKKAGHVLVISNPSKIEDFNRIVKEKINSVDPNKFEITISEMCTSFNSLEVIYIPHFHKNNSLSAEDMELLEKKVYSDKRLIKESSDIKSLGVLNSHGIKGIVGSDVKDWNKYEKSSFAELKYVIKGFDNFLKLLDKDVTFINDLINYEFYDSITVYGKTDKKKYPFVIDLYNDVNIIFGDKGSGKSEILESLDLYFKETKGITPIRFNGGDKTSWYQNLTKFDKNYKATDLEISNCEDEFHRISTYSDIVPTRLSSYIKYFENISKNKKRQKLKILGLSFSYFPDNQTYLSLYKQYKKIKTFVLSFQSFQVVKNNIDKYTHLEKELKQLSEDAYKLALDEWVSQKSKYLTDHVIQILNDFVSRSDGSPKMPTKTGIYDFYKHRASLKKDIDIINVLLNTEDKEMSKKYIGKIGEKGDCYLIDILGLVNESTLSNIESKYLFNTKKSIASFLNALKNVLINIRSINLQKYISNLSEIISDNEISSLNYFLFNNKYLSLNGQEYVPSKGEMAILSLQYELLNKRDNDVYLIDELEVNLGSTYIENTIVPLIRELAKAKKIIVIATHDANIATRTYPANSILKTVNNDIYTTYQGSMFTNELINITDKKDVLKWDEESQKYLEGGSVAFKERGNLYGD